MTRAGQKGFSLLEVMVAIAILGLSLTVILSAQGGLAASNRSAANMGQAAALARCKMTETEESFIKYGFPALDANDTAQVCCLDEDREGFKCDVKVEKVELPNFNSGNSLGDGGALLGAASTASNVAGGPGLNLDFDGGLQGLGGQVQGQLGMMGMGGAGSSALGGAGAGGLISMVMGIIYPSIKPFYEMSIRRVTIIVRWNEGPKPRDLSITQFVTNPQNFAANALLPDGGTLDMSSASPTGTSTTSTTSTGNTSTGSSGGTGIGRGIGR